MLQRKNMLHFTAAVFVFLVNGNCGLDSSSFFNFFKTVESSNQACEMQKNVFLAAVENREMWALTMLDAFGRVPNAITQGNIMDLGTYDQCVNIFVETKTTNIRGKYCLNGLMVPLSIADLPFLSNQENIYNPQSTVPKTVATLNKTNGTGTSRADEIYWVFLAACVPDSCLPSDLFGEIGIDTMCHTKNENKKLDVADVACLVFIGLIFFILVTSTTYDLYLEKCVKLPYHSTLLAFSMYSNGKKIFRTGRQTGQFSFFHGMKVLSMCWVILFHRFVFLPIITINAADFQEWSQRWYATCYWSAHLAVDTFLFISGVLITYNFLKSRSKPHSKFNVLKFYFHRYLRLTPPLAVLFFVQLTIVRRIASGPLYDASIESYSGSCRENWWAFFLYIQNYVVPDKQCMSHTWYLSVDMQFFILSPLILIPISRYGKIVSYTIIPVLVIITTGYLIPIFYVYDFVIFSDEYMQIYYGTAHSRFPPWLLGIMFGSFIIDFEKDKERYTIKNQLLISAIWVAVIALIAFLIIYQIDVDFNRTTTKAAVFYPLQKTIWAVCLWWICYACLSGNAPFIDWFLSASIFQVLSKVTYSTYLLHVTLILIHTGYSRTRFYFNDYEIFRVLAADIFIAYLAGTLWTLAFESPVAIIEKVIFGNEKERKDKTDCHTEDSDKMHRQM